MGTAFFTILNVSGATLLTAIILARIPHHVQKALGKIQPTLHDLLAMPEPTPDQRKCWLVYVDVTLRWEITGPPKDRHKTYRILHRGKYVGSSVDYRGGGSRLDKHACTAVTKTSSEKKQRHHEELCKERTEANLRILALFDCDDQIKPYVPLVETIFIVLIGTFVGREKPGLYNPQACYDLYDSIRRRARMPDIEGNGLNGALSIHQGMIGVSSGRQTYYCIICGLELPPNSSRRNNSRLVELGNPLGPRRCQTCERVFANSGEERISNPDGSYYQRAEPRKEHNSWIAAGHADVCGNPACAAPRVPGASFSGWMEKSRCQNCASFLNYQKSMNVPDAEIRERQPQERELNARHYEWSEEKDEVLKAESTAGIKFKDIVAEHFPLLTAQLLRERLALLKRNERTQVQKTKKTSTKAPDWADDEIRILKNGITNKEPAKALLPLLPQRTLTSIMTKMSCLRKIDNLSKLGLHAQHALG